MKSKHVLVAAISAFATLSFAKVEPARKINAEVVFVLDSTGSMGGLIDGAKKKIWSMSTTILETINGGTLKIGLVTYRDRGDTYITKVYDLTNDLDVVYANLMTFSAGEGADTPESVNQALHDALSKMSWSPDESTFKTIFLVGDAPAHMDYQDDIPYPTTCAAAGKRNIRINTVQCGSLSETGKMWRDIARLGEGDFVQIDQSGGMQEISTPYDTEIATLSAEVNSTVIPYGSEERQKQVQSKLVNADSASTAVQASRMAANSMLFKKGEAVAGDGDLVQYINDGGKISELKEKELPAAIKDKSESEILELVKRNTAKRDDCNQQIEDLNKKRIEHIKKELAKSESADAFDLNVETTIRKQLSADPRH